MPKKATVTSVRFEKFKAFQRFSIALRNMNILVGPNNSGKSTILGAFRVLDSGIKIARTKKPVWLEAIKMETFGYRIPNDSIPISLENVHTDYEETASIVDFRISNGNRLILHFTKDQGCYLIPMSQKNIRRPTDFKNEFPLTIGVVPVLGPLEHNEDIVEESTVKRAIHSHRASRHFRNYWRYFPEGFDHFAEMIKRTWPGMEISPPEHPDMLSRTLQMFCSEDRITRELYWAGFGFQVWCQLLTHICRASEDSILIIDEPEIYLHPDVQRQLLGILRDIGPDVLLATHSTEIMTEADPSEILLIDKTRQVAKRVSTVVDVQLALDAVGSIQNITLTQLARTRRVLFVEGEHDFSIIRRFAKILGLQELSNGANITAVESGGFTSWERIKAVAWGIERTLGQSMILAAVFDRDYWCDEQINEILAELKDHLFLVHFHSRKEIENHLLVPSVLDKALEASIEDRIKRGGKLKEKIEASATILDRITSPLHSDLLGQYIARYSKFHDKKGKDPSTLVAEALERFKNKWCNIETRLEIVNGKQILRSLRDEIQFRWQVNLTDARIVSAFTRSEISADMVSLLQGIEEFRTIEIEDALRLKNAHKAGKI